MKSASHIIPNGLAAGTEGDRNKLLIKGYKKVLPLGSRDACKLRAAVKGYTNAVTFITPGQVLFT